VVASHCGGGVGHEKEGGRVRERDRERRSERERVVARRREREGWEEGRKGGGDKEEGRGRGRWRLTAGEGACEWVRRDIRAGQKGQKGQWVRRARRDITEERSGGERMDRRKGREIRTRGKIDRWRDSDLVSDGESVSKTVKE
jgi:hypothetical protein